MVATYASSLIYTPTKPTGSVLQSKAAPNTVAIEKDVLLSQKCELVCLCPEIQTAAFTSSRTLL